VKKLLLLAIAIVFYAIAIIAKPSKKEQRSAACSGTSATASKTFE
jgi:hypothetical protein